ncbi:STAS domain-containing protein [Kitasatospora sp. NBC_00315]|uniref:STAS domain-containing protein n=1 Tax=Kitasatospora sp. NBC_00315 TaxID=2975963 RepID=UPI0032519C3F
MTTPADQAAPLAITARESSAGPVVEPVGAIDFDSAPLLRTALHKVLSRLPAPRVAVLDLSGVTFCDSSGLNAILLAQRRARHAGTQLRLASPGTVVARMLAMTGVDQVFPIDRHAPLTAGPAAEVA